MTGMSGHFNEQVEVPKDVRFTLVLKRMNNGVFAVISTTTD